MIICVILQGSNMLFAQDNLAETGAVKKMRQEVKALSLQVKQISGFQQNIWGDVENKKKELELLIKEQKDSQTDHYYIIIGSILLLAVTLWGGWQSARNKLLAKAEAVAAKQIEEKLEKRVDEILVKLLERKAVAFKAVATKAEVVDELKRTRKILVLEEGRAGGDHDLSSEESPSLVQALREMGYQHVSACVPQGNERMDADLVIFDNEKKTKKYEAVNNEFINKYIKSHGKTQLLLYFGPRNEELDTKTVSIGFSNYRNTLDSRIKQMFGVLAS